MADTNSILKNYMSARIFIRDDDVSKLDKKFRYFFELAKDIGLPVVYAVIPGKMDQGIVRFLNRAKEKTPRMLDIVQHGWIHANYSFDNKAKYEFGAGRSFKSQQEDIRQGLKRMRLAFGDHFTPGFVPPYHSYDQGTLEILKEEKFQMFSAGSRKSKVQIGIVQFPAIVSMSCYDNPAKISINKADDVIELLVRNVVHERVFGVVMHHADFVSAASCKELMRVFKLIAALKERKKWQVLLFSDFLSKNKGFQK